MLLSSIKQTIKAIEMYAQEVAKNVQLEQLVGPQGNALIFLYEQQQRQCETYQKDIEQLLAIHKSGASQLIARMVKNGYVTEQTAQLDGRYKAIHLTAYGLSKVQQVKQLYETIDAHVLKDVPESDLQIVVAVLKTMQQNLTKDKDKKITKDGK